MTVSTTYVPLAYAGNGSTTGFTVTWQFFAASDIVVTLVDSSGVGTVQTISTHYTVSGGQDSDGRPQNGTVTMVTAPASGEVLRITRDTAATQSQSMLTNGRFDEVAMEVALDRVTLIAQEYKIADDVVSYTVANLPAGMAGQLAYASNGRKNGEGVGSGTGVLVFNDGSAWRAVDTGATVAA